ncbi:hypothetical protein BGZ94_008010 [Podila epigama]|nr:hypothetical protein BGZ94_008010 [Podila epigama]
MVRSAIDPIRPGASLILAWQIKQKHVLIIGGGFVAAGRLVNVLEADAKVTLICPDNEELSDTVRQHLEDHPKTTRLVPRQFLDSDLITPFGKHDPNSTYSPLSPTSVQDDINTSLSSSLDEPAVDMVLSAIDDIPLSTHIYNQCKRLRIPVNIADVPPQCDFYFCSTHRDQSLQVAVSTSGKGPKLANLVRRHIADHLPNRVGDAIEQVGKLRVKLRKMAPGPEVGPKRMQWMSRICEEWKMEDLATLDDDDMTLVLEGFHNDKVYSFDEIQSKRGLQESNATPTEATTTATEAVVDRESVAAPELESTDGSNGLVKAPVQLGKIILVGAGPGDPELLTRKAARLLEEADLVVADRLIPTEVLDLTTGELRVAPKKRAPVVTENNQEVTGPTTSDDIQNQLNQWCLEGLREGKTVVRLKQGDPFIFGRGSEEILYFRQYGFEPEVVPGVSSALSGPLAANVPLTHRGAADQVVITTAQAKGGVLPDNFPAYDPKRTVVVLMGIGKAQEISELLQDAKLGWPADVPAVIVENAHCTNERTMDATVGTLGQVVAEKKAVPPSVIVIGWAGAILRNV